MRTLTSFVRAVTRQWQDASFRAIVGLAVGLLLTGTVFYIIVEEWSPLDALYFCVVTLATVGFGDLTPRTDLGKAFTIVFILVGVGIIVAFASRVVNAMVTDRAEWLQSSQRRTRERRRRRLHRSVTVPHDHGSPHAAAPDGDAEDPSGLRDSGSAADPDRPGPAR